MARASTTQAKRQRELTRNERAQDKAQQRAERKRMKAERPARVGGEDPDLAGIVPGPQPQPDED
jgi:hypothetical protein